ncbi:MAG TPA: AbrB/MazE/SpoVT family DNA-binding domain-containing protein [Pirellulaceae bacterium]|nr:AbrB/MazE/SpoVT family DNA-binding domain-containing protein [Pirellulaceae bacterium]
MIARIVPIGNSQGIRIPKPLLEEAGLSGEVEIKATAGALVVRPAKRKPREGWEEAFREMARQGDDQLDFEWLSANLSSFNEEEWQWK